MIRREREKADRMVHRSYSHTTMGSKAPQVTFFPDLGISLCDTSDISWQLWCVLCLLIAIALSSPMRGIVAVSSAAQTVLREREERGERREERGERREGGELFREFLYLAVK